MITFHINIGLAQGFHSKKQFFVCHATLGVNGKGISILSPINHFMFYLLLEALCSWPILREATYFDPNKMLAAPNPFFPSFLETASYEASFLRIITDSAKNCRISSTGSFCLKCRGYTLVIELLCWVRIRRICIPSFRFSPNVASENLEPLFAPIWQMKP